MNELEKKYKFKLSIITVNLNNKEGLQKTIDSVISQTYKDFEWIIIDGGSSDGSKELVEKYQDYINYWVSEPDTGIYNAMNKGILASQGEYLLFLNSGDYLYKKNTLLNSVNFFKGKDFYIGDCLIDNKIYSADISNNEQLCNTILTKFISHQSTFILKSCIEKFGFYKEDFKLISDSIFFFEALLLNKASYDKLPLIISIYDINGVSSDEKACHKELNTFFFETSRLKTIIDFYLKYNNLVNKIKKNYILKKFFIMISKIIMRF